MNWHITGRCVGIVIWIVAIFTTIEFGRATAQPSVRWINAETVKASNLLMQNGLILRFPVDATKVEFGLREDGTVVWKEIK